MVRRTGLIYSVLALLILCACARTPVEPEPLDFATDVRILRGVWEGTSDSGQTLRLEAEASSPTAAGYEVMGTFSLDFGTPVVFSGFVRVPVTQSSTRLTTQESPVCPGLFTAASPDSLWEFCGGAPEGSPPSFSMSLVQQSAEGGATNFSALTKVQDDQAATRTLVSGNIVYSQDEPHTHPEAFEFTEDSHAVVQLFYSFSALGDAPSELVAETRLEDITSFPLAYRIEGNPQKAFLRRGDYFLHVDVYSGTSDTSTVGDLVNEWYTPVPAPGAVVDVEVTALESH